MSDEETRKAAYAFVAGLIEWRLASELASASDLTPAVLAEVRRIAKVMSSASAVPLTDSTPKEP